MSLWLHTPCDEHPARVVKRIAEVEQAARPGLVRICGVAQSGRMQRQLLGHVLAQPSPDERRADWLLSRREATHRELGVAEQHRPHVHVDPAWANLG